MKSSWSFEHCTMHLPMISPPALLPLLTISWLILCSSLVLPLLVLNSCWEQPLPHHTRANIRKFSVMRCRSQRKHCRSGLCVFLTTKNSFTSICPHCRLSAAGSLMLSAVTSCISHLHPLTSSYIKRETALLFRFHWWHAGCRLRAAGCSLAAPGFPLNPPNPVNPS